MSSSRRELEEYSARGPLESMIRGALGQGTPRIHIVENRKASIPAPPSMRQSVSSYRTFLGFPVLGEIYSIGPQPPKPRNAHFPETVVSFRARAFLDCSWGNPRMSWLCSLHYVLLKKWDSSSPYRSPCVPCQCFLARLKQLMLYLGVEANSAFG